MKTLRVGLSIASLFLLLGGYLASQFAALNGTAGDYAAKVDREPIPTLALAILVLAIVLAFIRDREDSP